MRFYTEVEQTGSSNEFYDKFTIRYHISIIMKSMWESPTGVHKMAIVHESANGKNFIKFINMEPSFCRMPALSSSTRPASPMRNFLAGAESLDLGFELW